MQNSVEMKSVEQSNIRYDDPHHLVQMLMEGAIESVNSAKYHMDQKNIAHKCQDISKAMSIVTGLMASLDMEQGGDISENLMSLYDYMLTKLVAANLSDRSENLDEVTKLMSEIKMAWAAIPDDVRKEFAVKQQ
ncbi:MAG: flagellar export chaperone FliS [Gammaproteobacteria bacterium]|nr:flagellar export chaperone FliS [Gammaproteobacteria bacterium]